MSVLLRLVLAVLLASFFAAGASANVVGDMRIVGDAERTRFVVDLDARPDYRILRLSSPYRLVIDWPVRAARGGLSAITATD
jgi:N-acetylmuramoyl-L-alanine amidase